MKQPIGSTAPTFNQHSGYMTWFGIHQRSSDNDDSALRDVSIIKVTDIFYDYSDDIHDVHDGDYG